MGDGNEERVDDGGVPAEVCVYAVEDSAVYIALLPCTRRVGRIVIISQGGGGVGRVEATFVIWQ